VLLAQTQLVRLSELLQWRNYGGAGHVIYEQQRHYEPSNITLCKNLSHCGNITQIRHALEKARTLLKWKPTVFDSLIGCHHKAMRYYGLESAFLSEVDQNILDAFHNKGLGHLFRVTHAYYSDVSNGQVSLRNITMAK